MKTPYAWLLALTTLSASAANPYISTVYEYQPAPGQYINELPLIADAATANAAVAEQICGNDIDGARPGMISLGAFGGYVVFGFDHPVVNVPGSADFRIYGNAIRSQRVAAGGSSEPGIVLVSRDDNGDGLPNDTWYELPGSEYDAEDTRRDYTVTYYRPEADRALDADPDPNQGWLLDRTYIRWTDSDGASGYIERNQSHLQSYWPAWLPGETLTRTGTRLADNVYNEGTDDTPYWVMTFYDYGYVDNLPDLDADGLPATPGFDIGTAVDDTGTPVALPDITFIKVYTAVNQRAGFLGETSTEICGGEDLHPEAAAIASPMLDSTTLLEVRGASLLAVTEQPATLMLYSLSGVLTASLSLPSGTTEVPLQRFPTGLYVARLGSTTLKVAAR